MMIRSLADREAPPMELLLSADPSREMIQRYLQNGRVFIAEDENCTIGVYVLQEIDRNTIEMMNIAVAESKQGQGIGRKMISHAICQAKKKGYRKLCIGTGNSSIGQLALYQKCGFRIVGIELDYFVTNYPDPIFEDGIQCRDKIRLEIQLQEDQL